MYILILITGPSCWCQYCVGGQNHIYTKKYSKWIMDWVESIEKIIRGLMRLNRSESLIAESENQRVKLALGSVRKETLFRAVSNSIQWICLKSQQEKKHKLCFLTDWGKGMYSGAGLLKLMQEERELKFQE